MYLQELYSPGLPKNTDEYRTPLLAASLTTLGSFGDGHSLVLHHLPVTKRKKHLRLINSSDIQ